MRILYTGPLYDGSGYASFARNFIFGLNEIGANVKANPMSIGNVFPDLKVEEASTLKKLKANPRQKFDIQVMNTLPSAFEELIRPSSINVGFTMFETSHITKEWVEACNKIDAILVPSYWNAEVFKKSGVTVPIYTVPPGINPPSLTGRLNLPMLPDSDKVYKFYSVFEWTERKCPQGLIKTYLSTFTGKTNVALFIKTYAGEDTPEKKEWLAKQVKDIMDNMRLSHFPKVVLIPEILSTEHMSFLHQTCDCFVLPTRGEGIGLPTMEAMVHGKPVITTNHGGSLQFCKPNNSLLVDSQQTFVSNMPWIDCYEGEMTWAEPNLVQLGQLMKRCYENPYYAQMVGAVGRDYMITEYNTKKRSQHLLNVLEEIHANKIRSKQDLPVRKTRRKLDN